MKKLSLHLPRGRHVAGWSLAYRTAEGVSILGDSAKFLKDPSVSHLQGQAQLIFTSPPFPLNTKKRYGNLTGEEYLKWLAEFGSIFRQWLKPTGSLVVELGNAWEPGQPTMSTLPLKALLRLQEENNFFLCQEFICHNPARLPSPAAWVTVRRIRLKDSFTRLWWLSPVPSPKANNRRVLQEYGADMKRLLAKKQYNAGTRPSEHHISAKSFLRNNGGAISANVLTFSNTTANDAYHRYCRARSLEPHPARMPSPLAEFFIKFMTSPGDLVLDPFAGSNTTGAAAQSLRRRWISIEANSEYVAGSRGRFQMKRAKA